MSSPMWLAHNALIRIYTDLLDQVERLRLVAPFLDYTLEDIMDVLGITEAELKSPLGRIDLPPLVVPVLTSLS